MSLTSNRLKPSQQRASGTYPAADNPAPEATKRPLRETPLQTMGIASPLGNVRVGEQTRRLKSTAVKTALLAIMGLLAAAGVKECSEKTTTPTATKNALILPQGAQTISLKDPQANQELTCLRELAARSATQWVKENCDPKVVREVEESQNPVQTAAEKRRTLLINNDMDSDAETWSHSDASGEPTFTIKLKPQEPLFTASNKEIAAQ